MTNRDVTITLKAEVDQFKRGMTSASAATKGVEAAATKASAAQEKHAKRMESLGRVSRVAGAAILAGIGVGLVKSTQAASNLSETLNKSEVIFGSSANAMKSWAEGASKSMGLSTAAALESAAGFGDMFMQLGWTQDAAAKTSQTVVQLSADLGSFNNLPTAEVSEMIAAAFRGEYDSLQRLIPNINAARVEKEAMAATGKTVAKELTAQEKATATLAIVTKDGARAAGDFAKTSDGLANSQKIMAAEFENSQAKLGEGLMPIMASASQAATKLLEAFNSMPSSMRTAAVVIAAAAGALLWMAPKILAVRTLMVGKTAATIADTAATTANTAANRANAASGMGKGGVAGKGAGAALTTGVGGIATAGVAIVAAGYALNQYMGSVRHATGETVTLSEAIAQSGGKLTEQSRAAADAYLVQNDLSNSAKNLSISQDTMRLAVLGNKDAMGEVRTAVAMANQAQSQYIQTGTNVIGSLNSQGNAFDYIVGKLDKTAESTADVTAAIEEQNKALREQVAGALSEAAKGYQLNSVHAAAYGRAVVAAGRAAGDSDDKIRGMLTAIGATPREVRVALSATPDELNATLAESQKKINDLKQYKRPDIQAEIEPLQDELRRAQGVVDNLRQRKKPNIDAIDKATRVANDISTKINGIQDKYVSIFATTYTSVKSKGSFGTGAMGGIGKPKANAAGGFIRGPGTATSDSIPARLSDGEYVIKAAAVDHYGEDTFDRLNAMRFAEGGKVSKADRLQRRQERFNARKAEFDEQLSTFNQRRDTRQSRVGSTKESIWGSQLSTFDFRAFESASSATANAVRDQASAQDALFEARRRANTASRADRPEALRALAAAHKAVADATQATADAKVAEAAAKPTAANILANFAARVTKTKQFAGNLMTLRSWGLPAILISEIIGSGLESGSEMAAALVAGGVGNMGAFQANANALNYHSQQIGDVDASVTFSEGEQTFDQMLTSDPGAAPVFRPKKKKKKNRKRRAMGGRVHAGEEYTVGEYGLPELFTPDPRNGTITSNRDLVTASHATNAGMSGGSSAPITIALDGGKLWQGMVTHSRLSGFTVRAL